MVNLLNRYKKILIIFFLLLFPLLLLNRQTEKKDSVLWYEEVVLFFTAPVQDLISSITTGVGNSFNKYFWLAGRYEENVQLRKENLRLRGENFRLLEIEQENKRLRDLLKFKKDTVGVELLAAEVIAVDAKSEFKSIRINRGRLDGVREQLPVVTSKGIVGQVLRVYRNYSDILLITDRNSYVDAIIQRLRNRGVLEGNIDDCNLKYVLRSDEVQKGDLVISSGLDLVFPKGLPLGYVSEVKKEKYGVVQKVRVAPVVDFEKLEEVLVVLKQVSETKLGKSISEKE